MFGLAVVGIVDPNRILTNCNARPGDAIILTKPIGVGIISTAVKRGLTEEKTANLAIEIMSQLNREAAEVMVKFGAHACTDVTGFGLLGHLRWMTKYSRVDAVIYLDRVPSIKEAWHLAAAGVVPGGTLSNLDFVADGVEWGESISQTAKLVLCDAQTSGGLLIAVPSSRKDEMLQALLENGVADATYIGDFTEAGPGKIVVR